MGRRKPSRESLAGNLAIYLPVRSVPWASLRGARRLLLYSCRDSGAAARTASQSPPRPVSPCQPALSPSWWSLTLLYISVFQFGIQSMKSPSIF